MSWNTFNKTDEVWKAIDYLTKLVSIVTYKAEPRTTDRVTIRGDSLARRGRWSDLQVRGQLRGSRNAVTQLPQTRANTLRRGKRRSGYTYHVGGVGSHRSVAPALQFYRGLYSLMSEAVLLCLPFSTPHPLSRAVLSRDNPFKPTPAAFLET